MLAYTYIEQGKFELLEKQRPQIKDSRDAISTTVRIPMLVGL